MCLTAGVGIWLSANPAGLSVDGAGGVGVPHTLPNNRPRRPQNRQRSGDGPVAVVLSHGNMFGQTWDFV